MPDVAASDPFLGRATISRDAFAAAIRSRAHNAGIEAERDLGAYWDAALGYALDPNFLLSMWIHESQLSTQGVSVQTRSAGNTRAPSMGACPVDLIAGRTGHFPQFATFLDGVLSTAGRLASPRWPAGAPYGERTSIRQVFDHPSNAVWAPAGDAENDPNSYLGSMLRLMNTYADLDPPMAMTATTSPWPLVYQDYLTTNYTAGRAGHAIEALVLHVTAGASAASAINWFKSAASQVSSHYVIDRDGTIFAVVRDQDQAWCQGRVNQPNRDIPIIDEWMTNGVNPNRAAIGIEVAGYSSMQPSGQPPELVGYTEAQFDALACLLPALSARHGVAIDEDTVWGHCELDSVNRAACPGLSDAQWDRVYGMETPDVPDGPYATPNDAYDAWLADHTETALWSGEMRGRVHWLGFDPQPVARTSGNRLLAYDGGYARDVSGYALDDWAIFCGDQLTIYGEAPPPPPDIQPPLVGAAWPIYPADGARVLDPTVTFQYGQDAPTVDLEVYSVAGARVVSVEGWAEPSYGPVALARGTAYQWQLRGRDGHHVSDWSHAAFDVAAAVAPPKPKPPAKPKPPSGGPYPPVVTPTHAEQPAAVTWRNVSDNKIDLAVSRRWRPDCDGGVGPWPDTDQWLNAAFPGADTVQAPMELRKLTRRLSMHPPIVEAGWRAGLWTLVPQAYQVGGSEWEKAATEDYGDRWSSMPAHARAWASQICTLGTAIQGHPDLTAALTSLDMASVDAAAWSAIYHCLRRRVRSLDELSAC